MAGVPPVDRPHNSSPPVHVPASLRAARRVYIRHDAMRRPLQRPYDGPFVVLARREKCFVVEKKGRPYTVSIDRLKPAFEEGDLQRSEGSTAPPGFPSAPSPAPAPTPIPTPIPTFFSEDEFPPLTKTLSGRISRPPVRLNL